eukprot:315903-Amphidinium_carterae.1
MLEPLVHSPTVEAKYRDADPSENVAARTDPFSLIGEAELAFSRKSRPFKAWLGCGHDSDSQDYKIRLDGNPEPRTLRFSFPPNFAAEGRKKTLLVEISQADGTKYWACVAERVDMNFWPEMPEVPTGATVSKAAWFIQPKLRSDAYKECGAHEHAVCHVACVSVNLHATALRTASKKQRKRITDG